MRNFGSRLYGIAANLGMAAARVAGPGETNTPRGPELSERARWFGVLEHYYYNTVFEDAGSLWAAYKSNYNLPRNIRSLFNCTKRAVDWYPGAIYPGRETYGNEYAQPWTEATIGDNPEFVLAAEQAADWSNWEAEQYAWVRRGGLLGVALLAIVDDVATGKVYFEQIHPALVVGLELDAQGHIDDYAIEMRLWDDHGNPYTYRKRVAKAGIWTYKNDRPYDYDGNGAERENPYGFVPAVWTKHSNQGGPWGSSVIGATVAKLEGMNGSASSIHDFVLRFSEQGVIFSTDEPVSSIQRVLKGGATYRMDDPRAGREEVRIFKGPKDLSVHRLIENLGLGDGIDFLKLLAEEIEKDLPEITVEDRVLKMSQASGTTIARALSNVAKRHGEAMTNYDRSLIRADQMAAAIGGWRLNTGAWARPTTPAQRLFGSFDLTSYAQGQLDGNFRKRPLLQETPEEKVALIAAKEMIKSRQGLIELYGETEGARIYDERQQAAQESLMAQGRAFGAGGAAG